MAKMIPSVISPSIESREADFRVVRECSKYRELSRTPFIRNIKSQ